MQANYINNFLETLIKISCHDEILAVLFLLLYIKYLQDYDMEFLLLSLYI